MKNALLRLSVISALLLTPNLQAAQVHVDTTGLDKQLHELLNQTYLDLVANGDFTTNISKQTPDALVNLRDKITENHTTHSIGYTLANIDLIKENIDHSAVQDIVASLLANDGYSAANIVYEYAWENTNDYVTSKLSFEFAKYHMRERNWQQCADFLNRINLNNALSPVDRDYAYIMKGMLLQKQSKHRKAIEYYLPINPQSPHYAVAQLNLATAYIRQDWWTDAHIAINNAIKSINARPSANERNQELVNRLYTVLGYSQLQKEFFRDARLSFRQVEVDSPYSQRAFFGIGIAALHQGDFAGALNAFQRLKKDTIRDKSVIESYILAAVTLEKLGQSGAAVASFTEAITYYEYYLIEISKALDVLSNRETSISKKTNYQQQAADLIITQHTAHQASKSIDTLNGIGDLKLSNKRQTELMHLLTEYQIQHNNQTIQALKETRSVIDNYLDQARFGLARLYDAAQ